MTAAAAPRPRADGEVCPGAAHVGVVGAGWAGLAAAVTLVRQGHAVTVWEMAPTAGGRARTVHRDGEAADNGQHILIGAYQRTLALMASLGVDAATVLERLPLTLREPDRVVLALPHGPTAWAFARAALASPAWSTADALRLLQVAAGWAAGGFRCAPTTTAADLGRRLPPSVRRHLLEPLCVAALNTPADAASGQVLLTVLRDSLFGGRGAADLLLPRRPLGELLPEPALRWLDAAGATVRRRHRVQSLDATHNGWRVDATPVDAVVLACTAAEAARLAGPHAPAWAQNAAALAYEPIVTVRLRTHSADAGRWPLPMLTLVADGAQPAQFAFDLGALGGRAGESNWVVSGAAAWVDRGLAETGRAVQRQAVRALADFGADADVVVDRVWAEKRATFRCTPSLRRPPALVVDRRGSAGPVAAAGDYVDGPYPATLEGAVRAGEAAAAVVTAALAAARAAPPAARR